MRPISRQTPSLSGHRLLIRAVVGPVHRPPVAVFHYFRVRLDAALAEYIAVARRQPVFEMRRSKSGSSPARPENLLGGAFGLLPLCLALRIRIATGLG